MASTLSEFEKIQILLAEYNTLRDEVISRVDTGYQIVAFVLAALTIVVGVRFDWRMELSLLGTLSLLIWLIWLFAMRDLACLARRVIALEAEINKRSGEELLIYESRLGGGARDFWDIFGERWPFRRIA